ncbi:MAG: PKD domain-containing protein [Desulfobacterales bacterium]|nr:PKD domain-containing protein [Desulfobacterales bacterium]
MKTHKPIAVAVCFEECVGNFSFFKWFGVMLLGLFIVFSTSESARGADLSLFNSITPMIAPDPGEDDPTIIRSRPATINFRVGVSADQPDGSEASVSEVLYLNLFDDVHLWAVNDRTKTLAGEGMVWFGNIEGEYRGQAVLVFKEGLLVGNIALEDAFYQIRYDGGGYHSIREIDQGAFPPGADSLIPPAEPEQEFLAAPDGVAGDDGSTVDLMVVYTPQARSAAGGASAIEATIDLAVAESNQSYENSGITLRLNLVHTGEVSYNDSGDMTDDLCRITLEGNSQLPYPCPYDDYSAMDSEVQPWRDAYGADEVVLLVENGGGWCGIAWVTSSQSTAFAVVDRGCATGTYSFAHELGHNMGAQHDRDHASFPGAYSYSYGYQHPSQYWRTVMSYNCPSGCTRVNYWSNPDVTYGGDPMGVAVGQPDEADNRMTLNNRAYTVANFRQSPAPTADFSGSPLSGAAPLIVSFTDASAGSGVSSWSWNFGDGETDSSQNPTHVFSNAGSYTISLTAYNPSGSDNETKSNYISVSACAQDPVKVAGGSGDSRIQDVYDGAGSGAVIQSHALIFTEDLYADVNKSITLRGGYNCEYTASAMGTTLEGLLTISSGSLTIENLIIQ